MKFLARRVGTGTTFAVLLSTALLAADAAAAPPGCGDVVTASTTLTTDVGPCAHDGLIAGADNITIDLGGHRVFGQAGVAGDGVGIRVPGRMGVTVRNGRITDFDAGVSVESGATHNTVRGLLLRDNIGDINVSDFGDGIAVSGANENVIRENTVVHNGPFDGIGLFGPSSRNTVEKNVVRENNLPFVENFSQDDGIRVEGPGAKQNVVRGNTVNKSGLDGIAVFGVGPNNPNRNTANQVEGNTVEANGFGFLDAREGDGIRVFRRANETRVTGNQVHRNAGSGIQVDSMSNRILRNDARNNVQHPNNPASDFDLYDTNDPACDNNIWSGNLFVTASPACTTAP